MSSYLYTALGHSVRCPDGTSIVTRFQRGRWIVMEGRHQYEADDYAQILIDEDNNMLRDLGIASFYSL